MRISLSPVALLFPKNILVFSKASAFTILVYPDVLPVEWAYPSHCASASASGQIAVNPRAMRGGHNTFGMRVDPTQ